MANRKKQIASYLTGAAYVWIGVMHFIDPLLFTPLVPELIGAPIFWVYLSGVAEVALGMGLCVDRSRPYASRIIILMLLVLYSANLNMWLNDIPFNGHVMSTGEHVVRALMQLFLIMVALWLSNLKMTEKSKQ